MAKINCSHETQKSSSWWLTVWNTWYCFHLGNHQKHVIFLISPSRLDYMNATKQWFSAKLPAKTNPPSLSVDTQWVSLAGPVLESNGMCAIFQKKGKKGQKRANYFKIWAKMYKIWKYFEKGHPFACDYRMHETARTCSCSSTFWLLLVALL